MQSMHVSESNAEGRLAALLRDRRASVLERWTRLVLEDPDVPEADRAGVPLLLDYFPVLLAEVAEVLAPSPAPPGAAGDDPATSRVRDRSQRRTVDSVLRELAHLRALVLQLCDEEGIDLDRRAAARLHAIFDRAARLTAADVERAEQRAAEIESRRLASVLDIVPVAGFVVGTDGQLIAINRAAEALWGKPLPMVREPSEYVVYQAWWPSTGKPVAPEEWGVARAIRTGEACHDEEMNILTFDGQRKTILNSAMPIRDAGGAIVGAVAINVDVTDRVRAARASAALAEAGALFAEPLDYEATLAATAQLGAAGFADYTLVDLLDDGAQIRRLEIRHEDPERQATVRRALASTPPLDSERPIARVLRSGRPVLVHEMAAQAPDSQDAYVGALRALQLTSAMTVPMIARGRTIGAITFLLTEEARRYDERDLAVAEQLAGRAALAIDNARLYRDVQAALGERDATLALLDGLLASAPVGIGVLDHALRFLQVNDVLAAFNGIPRDRHLGRTVREVIPWLADQIEPHYLKVFATGEAIRDLEMTTESPDPRCWLINYWPVRPRSGEVEAVAVVVTEITHQKRAEEELRRDAALRERFIGILSHDLRTPLSAIKLTAGTLLARKDLGEPFERPLQRVKASAERIGRMADALLDLTRSRVGGGLPIARRPSDVFAICRQVVEELATAHPDRSIELVVEGSGEGAWDPDRLAQVVSNLVGNALTYSAADTPVKVAARGDAAAVVIEVHNQGAPITDEVMATMFDPFRRGARPGGASGGLGLGLFIAQQIVKGHGGAIRVTSDAAEGTTFTVELPQAA